MMPALQAGQWQAARHSQGPLAPTKSNCADCPAVPDPTSYYLMLLVSASAAIPKMVGLLLRVPLVSTASSCRFRSGQASGSTCAGRVELIGGQVRHTCGPLNACSMQTARPDCHQLTRYMRTCMRVHA